MHLFSSAYNEYTVISKEYTGPLDFDITGVDCMLFRGESIGRYLTQMVGPILNSPVNGHISFIELTYVVHYNLKSIINNKGRSIRSII